MSSIADEFTAIASRVGLPQMSPDALTAIRLITPIAGAILTSIESGAGERAALDAAAEALADLRARAKYTDFDPIGEMKK